MDICEYNKCTACAACINACPMGCISMREDPWGETHPTVDEGKCVKCRKCINVCPSSKGRVVFRMPSKVYAAWNSDVAERRISASGGLGAAIARFAINIKNGYFFGTRYDDSFKPCVIGTKNETDIDKYKGSKYVKSETSGVVFKEIKRLLDGNEFIAFVGTPCQVAGLESYLNKEYTNLLTVDLICHGTCPYAYFRQHVEHLKNKCKFKVISDIRFRGNDRGNNFKLTLWNNQKLIYRGRFDTYMTCFMQGIGLRENCYNCSYARPERVADITIGDFIGLGSEQPFGHPTKNVSSVFINTDRGEVAYSEILRSFPSIISEKRNYSERLSYGPSLRYPFERSSYNARFRDEYAKTGDFDTAMSISCGCAMTREKIKFVLSIPSKIVSKITGK